MRQPRVLSALILTLASASALGVYACDSGTYDDRLPVYQLPGPGTPPSSIPEDAAPADAQAQADGGDASPAKDGGDAGPAPDGGEGGTQLDGATDGGDGGALDAADGSG